MDYPIPPGNGVKPKRPALRWREQTERVLRGLWWVEALVLDDEIDADQVRDLKRALLGTIEMIEAREKREARKAKIEQLERVEGRTPEEAVIYLAKARQMREEAS